MSTEKMYKKLFTSEKVELSNQKIELSDFADIKSQLKKADTIHSSVRLFADNIYKAKQAAKSTPSLIDKLNQIISELNSDKDKFITQVRALGIDPSKLSQPKDYNSAISKISALEKHAKDMYNETIK